MRFTITRENLQQGLGAVAGSIPSRTTLPVLSNILIEAEDGAVRMSGTDLDTAVSVRVAADVAEPGAITAPAKKLQEIARELPGAVEFNTQGDAIQISSGRTKLPAERPAPRRVPRLPQGGLRGKLAGDGRKTCSSSSAPSPLPRPPKRRGRS